MIFSQIFDMVDIGLVVLDRDLKVQHWNRWMQLHSGISAERIIDTSLFDHFPHLNTSKFLRNCKSVLHFGNFSFLSQKLHHYLFPFKPVSSYTSTFEFMQQNCTIGPLRDDNKSIEHIYISVQDVTAIAAYEKKLTEMNLKDGLTGIYNRRFLETKLVDEFERYRRYKRPLTLILFDIDFFKKVNDTYGHQCGDHVLKVLSSYVDSSIRKIDTVARYGGEEFCLILPETNLESSLIVAERLRENVAQKEITFMDSSISITISMGVAEAFEGIDSPEELLKRADEALYEAKRSGRNRVVTAHSLIPS